MFFFAFSVLEEFLKLNSSDGEYFMFGIFKLNIRLIRAVNNFSPEFNYKSQADFVENNF